MIFNQDISDVSILLSLSLGLWLFSGERPKKNQTKGFLSLNCDLQNNKKLWVRINKFNASITILNTDKYLRIFKDVFVMFASITGAFMRHILRIDRNCVSFAIFEPFPWPSFIQMASHAWKKKLHKIIIGCIF